jgi:hypothetical protein
LSDAAAPKPTFRRKLKLWTDRAGMGIWGAGIASTFGMELATRRWPNERGPWPLAVVALIYGTWEFFRKDETPSTGEGKIWFLFCTCLSPLYYARHQPWTPPILAIVVAAYLWALGEKRRRPIPIAVSGTLLTGAAATRIPWPPVDQSLLVLIGVGVSAFLQGTWFLLAYLRSTPPPEPDAQPAPKRPESN